MSDDIRGKAVRIYDAFTHGHRDRRRLLREMAALAGSVAAAEALIAGVAASPAAAQLVPADDPRLAVERGTHDIGVTPVSYYRAVPRDAPPRVPPVMVVHENRGLNAHIEDVARRLALAGFQAFAVDFLSLSGGTPADEDAARESIGRLDMPAAVDLGVRMLAWMAARPDANGKAGAIGFCWGGAMVNRLAVAAGDGLRAGVSYYGPAPDPAEAAGVEAALMIHLAGNDARVNASGEPWAAALEAAGKTVEAHLYPGAEHAFNNDTSAARYDAEAAKLAWERTIAFLKRHLDG